MYIDKAYSNFLVNINYILQYQDRRCITEHECYTMPKSRVDLQNLQSWKPFNNTSCLLECPPGYEEVPTEVPNYGKVFKCQECSGTDNLHLNSIKNSF